MPKLTKSAIDIFDEYSAAINKCQRELASQSWFDNGWCINKSFHSRGFTFQLYKANWYNNLSHGVHIEFWIEEKEVREKQLPIVLHFEADTPNRKDLGVAFKERFLKYEHLFGDYRINHSAICDKLQTNVPLTKTGLSKVVVREFSKMQVLDSIIDELM